MRRAFLFGLAVVAALALAVPVGLVGTFVLFPLWRWCEETLGIEAIGHSAPADWCFVTTYAALAVLVIVLFAWRAAKRPEPSAPSETY